MYDHEFEELYFQWIVRLVCEDPYFYCNTYSLLTAHLFQIPFTYIMPRDENRLVDGRDLRYNFGSDEGYSSYVVDELLGDKPVSVLEVIAALALRMEIDIMASPSEGDRVGEWFWSMIESMGLGVYDDIRYDERQVDHVVSIFLNRQYAPNGRGGLFTIHSSGGDMRQIEIWFQMHAFINDMLERST